MAQTAMALAAILSVITTSSANPVEGRALLQSHGQLTKVPTQSAKKRSMKLIDHMFGGPSKKFDLTSIERALSGPGDTLDSKRTKDLLKALNLQQDPESTAEGPGGMSGWIKSQLLPQAEQTKVAMQGEIDRAVSAVEECKKLNWHAQKAMEHRGQLLASDEGEKFKCLAEEHQLHLTHESNCRDVDAFVKQLEAPSTLTDTDHTDRTAVKTVLRENLNFFNNAHDQFTDLYQACVEANAAAANQDKQCDADAEVVAEFYCHMKSGRDKACSEFGDCFEAKKAIVNTVVQHVKVMEAENKAHFTKLACSAFNSESIENEVSPECAMTVNTAHLEVEYPDDLEQPECIGLVKTRQNYTGIECNADGSVDHSSDADVTDTDGSEMSSEADDTAAAEGSEGSSNATAASDDAAESDDESAESDDAPTGNATATTAASGNATAFAALAARLR